MQKKLAKGLHGKVMDGVDQSEPLLSLAEPKAVQRIPGYAGQVLLLGLGLG